MHNNTNPPTDESNNKFRLSDKQRRYFGLDPIDEHWDEVEIKEGTTVFYDGDVIKKIITSEYTKRVEFTECDTELYTRERKFLLPKTERGKEKKITPTNLLSVMPTGCKVYISLKNTHSRSYVSAYSPRNNISLPITDNEDIEFIAELQDWLENYMKTCPPDYFEKVNRMRTLPHRTIKYNTGDLVRFEIDREYYGFALIIGKLRELQKLGVFCEGHPMHDLMTVPILIRIYKLKTKNKNMPINEIIKNELLATKIMSDNNIIWGTHEIIGNKQLEESDIDFPMQYGFSISANRKRIMRFAWGMGMIRIDDLETIPNELKTSDFLNIGVSCSLPIHQLTRVLDGQSEYNRYDDLRHPDHDEMKQKVFWFLGLPSEIDMDRFNEKYNGMTRRQYIDFLEEQARKKRG